MPKPMIMLMILCLTIAAANAGERSPYGGWTALKGKATGFFHVEKIGDKWWCIDPSGAAFYAIGTDHCNYNVHWCEALGYAPYAQNVRKKYNNDESAWAKSATDRLKQWNFNALGANNSPSTRGRGLAYMEFCGLGADYAGKDPLVQRVHWTGFPNVFNPAFEKYCEERAQAQCAPLKDDPWLFGWFLDNELEWYGKGGGDAGLANEAIKRPADHEGKKALVELLKKKYQKIQEFNATWGTSFNSWEEALNSSNWNEHATEKVFQDKIEFVRLCAEKYFAITTNAIRKADPNHMILGCRFAGNAPPIWDIAGKYCDIVTFNIYGQVDLQKLEPIGLVETITKWYKQAKRPMMVTEWSFPALDSGLPCRAGAGMRVRTQAEKAKCFEVYQKTFFSLPFMVGSDYFMWVDEPALGISKNFPEDSNYGLVDVNDEPWQLFTDTVAKVNAKVYEIHSGRTSELSITGVELVDAEGGKEAQIKIKNTGVIDAKSPVLARVDDRQVKPTLSIPAGGYGYVQVKYPLKPGAHYIEAEADPDGLLNEVKLGDNRISKFIYVPGAFGRKKGIPIGIFGKSTGKFTISIPLSKASSLLKKGISPEQLKLMNAEGMTIPAEIFDLDDSGTVTAADELAFEIQVPASQPQTLFLEIAPKPYDSDITIIKPKKARSFSHGSKGLRITKAFNSGKAIDAINLDDMPMGSFEVLIQQVAGDTWWDRPDCTEELVIWAGSTRTRCEVTLSRKTPGTASGPFAFRTKYAFEFYPQKNWFTARFISLTNTDNRPWTMESYFYYPQSAIGGNMEDDEVGLVGACGTGAWIDQKAGGCYGIIAPSSSGVTVYFWKDDAGNEHADARKTTSKLLKPGETFAQPGEPVFIFCATTKNDPEPWKAFEQEIGLLPKWEIFR
ncbi:MAG: beta-galactosidase [Armatimonadota bacterium]|nr:beta-galactosidase [Armatimonadota bacterium]